MEQKGTVMEGKYDISEAEASDRAARENVDHIGSLLPAPNEDRPSWLGRVFRAVAAWWRKLERSIFEKG